MSEPADAAVDGFTVNGRPVVPGRYAGRPLIELLRDVLGLTGTKLGCGNGECGACTVLVDGVPVCSCIVTAGSIGGTAVTTVEGLAPSGQLTALQESFVRNGALQCGFCTPGMLMSATALLRINPKPSREEIIHFMNGNVCRCTGYAQIVEAIQEAATHG
jgi:carbon-monoxide dehydrogenase small subunit